MARRIPWWAPALIVLLIPVFISGRGGAVDSGVTQGPLFEGVPSLDSLIASAVHRRVVLNFWATWCSPCVHELPILDSLYRENADQAVFIAVSIGDPSLSTLVSFREAFTVSMPVVWLSSTDAELVRHRYGIPPVLPVTLFLVEGTEAARVVGARPGSYLGAVFEGAVPTEVVALHDPGVHIFVVGDTADPLTGQLFKAAVSVVGHDKVDLADPGTPSGAETVSENFLPVFDRPYAQVCVGPACYPPVFAPESLLESLVDLD